MQDSTGLYAPRGIRKGAWGSVNGIFGQASCAHFFSFHTGMGVTDKVEWRDLGNVLRETLCVYIYLDVVLYQGCNADLRSSVYSLESTAHGSS
jgi:hypothetical protein